MRLLTWHGTIIRLEKATGRLTHGRLVPLRDLAADFAMTLPEAGLTEPLLGPGGISLVPGGSPGTAHLLRDGKYMRVTRSAYPVFATQMAGLEETLWLVPDADVALLRDLLSHAWVREDTSERFAATDLAVEHGPDLRIGGLRLPLHGIRPEPAPDGVILPGDPPILLRRVPENPGIVGTAMAREVPIRQADPARVPDVDDEAAFRATCPARYTIPAPSELGFPPILIDRADRDFVYRHGWRGRAPICGRHHLGSQIVRERDKFVLLERQVEGMILDAGGVSNEYGYIGNLDGHQPPYFGREGDQYFLDQALLDAAPRLGGPFAVFYGGNYQNYYHWLIDALVPLSLMAPLLPPDITLLLPGSLAHFRQHPIGKLDYLQVLEAFGFGGMARLEVAGQICHVDEVYWPDRCNIHQLPASALRAARDRALGRLPPVSGGMRRIYIKRADTRGVANAGDVEPVLRRNGFDSYLMEDLTAGAQIDLFRHAEMVVGPHGAALANLMFCPPGTQVLELSPDCEYRPFFNEMCGKLGLGHAVLPCPTQDGGFFGQMRVDPKRLAHMLRLLSARQAA
jgi:hypothetical protein